MITNKNNIYSKLNYADHLVKFQRRSIYKFTIHINRLFPLESCFPDHRNLKFYNPSPFLLLKQSKYSKSFRIVLFFHKSQVDATQTAIPLFSNFNMTLKRLEMIFCTCRVFGCYIEFHRNQYLNVMDIFMIPSNRNWRFCMHEFATTFGYEYFSTAFARPLNSQ